MAIGLAIPVYRAPLRFNQNQIALRTSEDCAQRHRHDTTAPTWIFCWQRLWLRLGVNIDDQLWLRLNPIPIPNCNPSANPSPIALAL